MKVIRLKHLLKGNFGGVWGDDLDCNENSYTYILRSTEQNENGNWVINWESVARRNLLRVTNFHTLKKNDIVITKSSGSAGHIGKATLVDENIEKLHCSFSNFMQCLQLDAGKCNPRFYWYYLNSRHCKEQYKISCTTSTGLLNLNSDTFNNLNVPFFSVEYQNQCVAFLDKTISKIEDAIEKHKIQLDFLSSYRQSLITRAVTKGLDPNVEMKDSGVEWIGDIPKHWHVCKLKHAGYSFNGLTYSPNDLLSDGIPVLRSCNVQNAKLDLSDTVFVSKEQAHDAMLEAGDVLICSRNGSAKLIGKCAYISQSEKYAFGAFMMVYRSSLKKFGYYLLNSDLFRYYKPLFSTTTINQLTSSTFGDFFIPLPPEMERVKISESLDKELQKIDSLSRKVDQIILKLKEYRSSLISAAVTGQLAIEEASA